LTIKGFQLWDACMVRGGGSIHVPAHVRRARLRRPPSDTRNEMGNQGNKPFAGFILRMPAVLLNARVDIPRTDRRCFSIFFASELGGVAVYGDGYALYNLVECCVDLFISQDRLECEDEVAQAGVQRLLMVHHERLEQIIPRLEPLLGVNQRGPDNSPPGGNVVDIA
jgi:hypothetical protein